MNCADSMMPSAMPRKPKLSYLKCHRCRQDRQKCLPLSRVWPQRCDRCERYNYECSESRLKSEKRTTSLPGQNLARRLPTGPQAVLEDNGLPLKSFRECIQDLGSLRILNTYVENLYSKGDNDSIYSCETIVRNFLSEKNSIFADARSTAKHLQARGQFAEAAILLERIQTLFIPDSSLLADHISLLEALNDHASAQILQKRLIASLTDGVRRKLAISKLLQLYHTSSNSILSSIKRCLRKAAYNSPPAEKLEDGLTKIDPNKIIPTIHQVLSTMDNNLVSEAVRRLDWTGAEDLFGSTALICATLLNFVEGVKTLLNAGADVGGINASLQTPLHVAASRGYKEIVEILTQAKADVDAINSCLQTPLHVAASWGFEDIVEILIQAKSDVDKEDILTMTPSHLAAANGHVPIIRILQEYGADIEISDHIGRTPLAIAVECDQEDVATCLVERGAELEAISKGQDGTELLAKYLKDEKFLLAKRATWTIRQRTLTRPQQTHS